MADDRKVPDRRGTEDTQLTTEEIPEPATPDATTSLLDPTIRTHPLQIAVTGPSLKNLPTTTAIGTFIRQGSKGEAQYSTLSDDTSELRVKLDIDRAESRNQVLQMMKSTDILSREGDDVEADDLVAEICDAAPNVILPSRQSTGDVDTPLTASMKHSISPPSLTLDPLRSTTPAMASTTSLESVGTVSSKSPVQPATNLPASPPTVFQRPSSPSSSRSPFASKTEFKRPNAPKILDMSAIAAGKPDDAPPSSLRKVTSVRNVLRSIPGLIKKPSKMENAKEKEKEDAVNIKELEKKLGIKVTKDEKDQHRNIRKAACFMVDAYSGRLKNGLGSTFDQPIWVRAAFQIHMKRWYKEVLRVLAVALMLLVFFEPASFRNQNDVSATDALRCQLVELSIILCLLTDFLLRLAYMGRKNILEKYFIKFLLYVELFCLGDVVVALVLGRDTVRVSRIARPAVYILVDKGALQLARQCLRAERKLRPLLALLLFWIALCAIFCSAIFSVEVWNLAHLDNVTDPFAFNWIPFQDFTHSVTPLISLGVTQGYSEAQYPFTVYIPESVVYFYIFIVVGVYVLMNLAIAVQVDEFQQLQKKSTTTEEKKIVKTLTVVFYLARDESTLRVSYNSFIELINAYAPTMKLEVIKDLFVRFDKDNSRDLDLSEFLDICEDMTSLEMQDKKNFIHPWPIQIKNRILDFTWYILDALHRLTPPTWSRTLDRCDKNIIFNTVMALPTIGNMVLLGYLNDQKPSPFVTDVLGADDALLLLFAIEAAFRLVTHGRQRFWDDGWNKYMVLAIGVNIIIFALEDPITSYFETRLKMIYGSISVHKVAVFCRSARMFRGIRVFDLHIRLCIKTGPAILDFAKNFVCIIYSHAIVSQELMWRSEVYTNPKYTGTTQSLLLQEDGWQDLLYTLWMDESPQVQFFSSVLIFAFIWYMDLIFLSQLMATVYDIFKVHKDDPIYDPTALLSDRKVSKNWRRKLLGADVGQKIKQDLVNEVGYNEEKEEKARRRAHSEGARGSSAAELAYLENPAAAPPRLAAINSTSDLDEAFLKRLTMKPVKK